MNEDKSSRYHRLQRRASIASFAWSAALLVALASTSGSLHIRDAVTALTASAALAIVLYVVALTLLHEIGAFPLALYSDYFLEHRYGLSRQALREWLLDHAKGTAIGLALVVGLASLLYWTMRVVPGWWWLASGLFFAAAAGDVRAPRARAAAARVLPVHAARRACPPGASRAPGRTGRRARDGRVPVGAGVEDVEGECGARRIRTDPAHPDRRHDAGSVLRRRDRGGARARARAPRPSRHLDGDRLRDRADAGGVLRGAPRAGVARSARRTDVSRPIPRACRCCCLRRGACLSC